MKPRLIMIVLGLVVIPTAILSFLANRALESREVLLLYRLKTDAASAIQVASKRVQSRFEDDMEHVRAVVSECLARGWKNADLEAAAGRLKNSRGTINRVFVYMNPWGFVFPEQGGKGAEDRSQKPEASIQTTDHRPQPTVYSLQSAVGDVPAASSLDSLVSALRREIALVGSVTNAIRFTVEDASYWFSILPDRMNTYAGFEINQKEFNEQMQNTLASASGDTFVLVAEGPGIARTNEVLISDVFGEHAEARLQRSDLAGEPVASGRLMKPFDYVNIKAFVVDPGKIRKAAEFRYRLYAWGILLMAAGICLGVWLVIRESAAEIRRARTRSDFVIGVSHDLRTPVASMKMLAESLFMERVSSREQQKKFLQVIVRESERLSQLIERVLFFVRMDQDALVYSFGQVDIGSLVTSAVSSFRARTEAGVQREGSGGDVAGRLLTVDCKEEEPGDRSQRTEDRGQRTDDRGQLALRSSSKAQSEEGRPEARIQHPESRNQPTDHSPQPTDDSPQTTDHRPVTSNQQPTTGSISLSVAPGIPAVRGDESSITQVVLNLLDNAMKYSGKAKAETGNLKPESGKTMTGETEARSQESEFRRQNPGDRPQTTDHRPQITVSVRSVHDSFRHSGFLPRRQWVVISVRDNGMGIDRKQQRKIFRRFYRVPGTGDSNVSGVGLGLALCKHVAKAHAGWIEVESQPGNGSTFSVYLPACAKGEEKAEG